MDNGDGLNEDDNDIDNVKDDDDDNVKDDGDDDGDDVDNVKDGLPEQKRPLHPSRLLCCASLPSLVLSIIKSSFSSF